MLFFSDGNLNVKKLCKRNEMVIQNVIKLIIDTVKKNVSFIIIHH